MFTTGLIRLLCPASLRKQICQGSPFNRSPYRQKNRSSTELIQLAVLFHRENSNPKNVLGPMC